jgi:hypothetical protein
MFQRGQDVRETLNLGKYPSISKNLKEIMDSVLSGKGIWSTHKFNIYQVEPSNLIHENKVDRGGGNNHKFYSYLTLNDPKNYASIKDLVKTQSYSIERVVKDQGFKTIAINFYTGPKHIRKAGFEYKEHSLLIEIVYAELRKK